MALPKPNDNFLRRHYDRVMGTFEKDAEKRAYDFASEFVSFWFQQKFNLKDFKETFQISFERLEMLITGLRKVYQRDARCWESEEKYRNQICRHLFQPLIDQLTNDTYGTRSFRLLRALAIIIACNKLQVRLDQRAWQQLCRSVMVTPDPTNKNYEEVDEIRNFLDLSALKPAVIYAIKNVVMYDKDPSWMFCLPLLHFSSKLCEPYEEMVKDLAHAATRPTWWGIADIEAEVVAFQNTRNKLIMPLENILKKLGPLFEMDFYLPRSIIASLTVEEIFLVIDHEVIPVEILCATLLHWMKSTNPKYFINNSVEDETSGEEKLLTQCLAKLLKRMQTTNDSAQSHRHPASFGMAYCIARELVVCAATNKRTEKLMNSVHIFLQCSSVYSNLETKDSENKNDVKNAVDAVASKVLDWLGKLASSFYDNQMLKNLKVWENAITGKLSNDDFAVNWNGQITRALQQKMESALSTNRFRKEKFIGIYCAEVEKFNTAMNECLTNIAVKAIDGGCMIDFNHLGSPEKKRFRDLLSDLFQRKWQTYITNGAIEEKDKHIFKLAISWPPIQLFVRNLNEKDASISLLTDDCKDNLLVATTLVKWHWETLKTGNIDIGILQLISEHSEEFSEIVFLIQTREKGLKDKVLSTIKIRMFELEAFKNQSRQMTLFVNHCQHLNSVDTSIIDEVQEKTLELEKHSLMEFCKPKAVNDSDGTIDGINEPDITAFNVEPKVLDILQTLESLAEGFVFKKMWRQTCSRTTERCKTPLDVVNMVWNPVIERWNEFRKCLDTGELMFARAEEMFGIFKNEDEQLLQEMQHLNLSRENAIKRIKQIERNRQLSDCVAGAKVILKFKKQFRLQGNFQAIKIIISHSKRNFRLRDFDASLMETCEILRDVTQKESNCLDAFVKSAELIKWLKETMRTSGKKELKVFVDLAMMSAGEEPMNIGKVQCLHSAVLGYSPFIFELDVTDCDYKRLLDMCKIVWKELAVNPNLPQQLLDTNGELEWLKEIKKAHGSVEVTSLMQAEAINADGIYTVGREARTGSELSDMIVKDIIKLTVPEIEGQRQLKRYTFGHLQDLQSRLMLVAGKSDSSTVKPTDKKSEVNVDRFTMIFDSMTRLGIVYLKLCSSGCVLFNGWNANFVCSPVHDRPVCATLEFGKGKDIPKLKGRKSDAEGLEDMVPKIAEFMENCYDEWLEFIKEKRKIYLYLNFFTIAQLVILQRELVKMGTDEEPSLRIYHLLSAVKENCTQEDVVLAMENAKRQLLVLDDEPEETIDEIDNQEEMSPFGDEKIARFVRELVEAGCDETVARKSVDNVNQEDIDECDVTEAMIWCMDQTGEENEDGEMNQYDVEDTQHTKPMFSGWRHTKTSIKSVIKQSVTSVGHKKNMGVKPLINDLKELWKNFLGSISSNISDYLSLEHLGIILNMLAETDTRNITRNMPPVYMEQQLNLIVCPSDEVLRVALSIYMHDPEQPLPQSDEVLVCTSDTTEDEVSIFWRRSIYDGSGKIHCLLYADLLDFDVSEAAEQCLEELLLDIRHFHDIKYRLFVICGSDNEYRSTIVSFLEKCVRLTYVSPADGCHLKEYVTRHLEAPAFSDKPCAAMVDFKRSTVRVIKSTRAGVGKTLFVNRKDEEVQAQIHRINKSIDTQKVSIPLQEKVVNLHSFIQSLLEHTPDPRKQSARIFHLNINHEVQEGVDYVLFNLLILNCLVDKSGYVWRRSMHDLYLIEAMPIMFQASDGNDNKAHYVHPVFTLFPDSSCRSPVESLQIYSRRNALQDFVPTDQLFDRQQFRSPVFQRTFQYLLRLDQQQTLDSVKPHEPEGNPKTCLDVLLRHCGVRDPSWSELNHFVWFLNTQLVDFEQNQFVSVAAAKDLPGFATFVLRFLIQMSRDFSTRSLSMSEESPGMIQQNDMENEDEDEIELYQMRRTWESSPHPYLFFNSDRFTFTFLGFYIDRNTGNLVDQQTDDILEQQIMSQHLYDSLVRNRAPIREDFDALPRDQKIIKLCSIMGVEFPHDPDSTYELTTDNVKKIMAIYMRFRCDIPVIIMGETGCGKTRLIKFMCALQSPPGVDVKNMILMKVHGGTTTEDIERKVNVAEVAARENIEKYGRHMYTVLFFDEANTTEAIGLIKEIMCDKSIAGKRLALCENLKIVAACNPYRKHSDELIKKLEQAGLGYHVDADETTDRLGRVPMRRLVYRVQPLPQSLLPLVWDFGQLNTQIEELYIRQMVRRYINDDRLPNIPNLIEVVSRILTVSQDYMRAQKDECSFVSLRDVERVLTVMAWFYDQGEGRCSLFEKMDRKVVGTDDQQRDDSDEEEETEDEEMYLDQGLNNITRALVLALGVCYHACLKTRQEYRQAVVRHFRQPCNLQGGEDQILEEIERCQDVFLENVSLEENIAKNTALKENVFMMVVCIELRIPLFLVGKPGSSKSLAKTIVSDAMQGNSAKHELFRKLKQVQMVSFQCSPLSTPDGIVGTFRQCAQFQKDKDLQTFVSAVVLDEVGLAEDSPRMPLKTLHPLLEDGCQGDEDPEPFMKVAFIGISNWALDPAKMNRGILVQREVPDLEELQNSARGICGSSEDLGNLIEPLSKSYLDVFAQATENMREFFGLRDFYSLVKMVYSFVEKSHKPPTWYEMLHAILRNFGGLDQVNPEEIFKKHLARVISCNREIRRLGDPDCSPAGLIQACLFDTHKTGSESRYMLLLTENFGAVSSIQQVLQTKGNEIRPITIFGSSFRSDQEYTQVCRNINKIKVCMETGNTVVLLNLENLYESLYDALNQYYVYFGGERYVDLGLGTHRVKCPVHRNFRLIVVAEKQTVYKKFPIPLINRLEKHFLTVKTTLNDRQQRLVSELEMWASDFASQTDGTCCTARNIKKELKIEDIFIGYHRDSCSAIILDVSQTYQNAEDRELLEAGKLLLLWCATPESVERSNKLDERQRRRFQKYYYERQAHGSLVSYLKLKKEKCRQSFAQVTTHSKLLASIHKKVISLEIGIDVDRIFLLETLSSFDTEQQFTNRVQQHLERAGTDESLMLIQCDSGDVNANLIACARYIVMDEYEKAREKLRAPVHAVFIVQLPRKAGGCFTGFQCGRWHSAHIDDLCPESTQMPDIQYLQGKTVSSIFHNVGEKQSHHDEIEGEQGEEMDRTDNRTSGTQMPGKERGIGEGGNMDVDEMDIDVEFNMEVDREQKKQDVIKLHGLIMQCVQSALAMVKDKKGYTQRETRRVDIVLKCLRNDKNLEQGVDTFLTGLQRLIGQLLKEKEEKNGGKYIAQLWMTREAAAPENINKAGTFRRSCHQTIISKVSPILAGIIAYLDTNRNLDLIHSDVWWKRTLWTSVLNTEGAIKIQYSDLQSPKRRSDLGEMLVMTTGFQGHMFSACLPFSWMMKEMIADILHDILPSDEEYEDEQSREVDEQSRKVASCAKIVSASQMGKILNQLVDGIQGKRVEQKHAFVFEFVHEYIQDFVQMMYYPGREDELKLVCQTVQNKTMEICEATNSMGCQIQTLTCVHIAYEILALRLTYLRSINGVWPHCSSAILDVQKRNPDHFMFKEQEFTFSALCLLIEDLNPKLQELNEEVQREKWLHKVHLYRPVVEKVLNLHSENPALYGIHSAQSVRTAKSTWARVIVTKLFIEHVCKRNTRESVTIKYCMPLWKILSEEVDMKEQKSLEGVEKFLKMCNQQALKLFYGTEIACCACEKKLQGAPVTLPCNDKDVICDSCLREMKALDQDECPKCHENLGLQWQPMQSEKNSKQREQLIQYQKRCNAFFMDVIAQLCFADGLPPSKNVLEKLLGYVTCFARDGQLRFTKNLTIFETGLDPNPVFRSFLLQLMLKSSEEEFVKESLRRYIEQAHEIIRKEPALEQNLLELSLLIIQCLEDTMLQQWHKQHVHGWSYIIHLLETARDGLVDEQIDHLYGIARTRVGLSQAARVIADIVNAGTELRTLATEQRNVIDSAKRLCSVSRLKWPRTFLVKHLCRCYGIDVYQSLCKRRTTLLSWIVIEELERDQTQEVSDRYVVCGEDYVQIREALSQVILGEDISTLEYEVQELRTTGGRVDTCLQLAVHREITCSYVRSVANRTANTESLKKIAVFLGTTENQRNKLLLKQMMNNTLEPGQLVTVQGSDTRRQGGQCLIVHFMTVLAQLNGDRTLLHLFLAMIRGDPAIRGMFLPTMLQDDFAEVQEAMLGSRGGENPVFYRCPNGHPYVIGNCGRPYHVAKCKDCGADIGGQGHQALPGNVKHAGGDNTLRGHILGRAVRNAPLRPERELSALHCCVIRLLLHMSMFLGPSEQIVKIVRPDIEEDNIRQFSWEHIEANIHDLQRALGRSVDDVLVLMHYVIKNIMVKHSQGHTLNGDIYLLQTKQGRQAWEKQFANVFLQDVFQKLDHHLKHFNQVIATDQRLGSNPLMCILYETDKQQQAEDSRRLVENSHVWRYRTPISIEHMRQDLETRKPTGKDRLLVLRLFLKQDHILQAIQSIPSILSLQRILLQKFQRKLDKAEANTILVKDMIKEQLAGPDTEKMLQDFGHAWDITRKLLELYVCTTEFGSIVVPKNQCANPISAETPLSVFLPTSTENGLCSYAMLDLLFRKQNEFLDGYMKESERSTSIETVTPQQATSAHLISYNHEQDILPLVLANCRYTFEMGKGTKIKYDFAGLESQIMDRFLFSKSRIDIGNYLQIDQMVYRTEFTNAAVFEILEEKIPQRALGIAVKKQISEEIKSLPDLCRFLDNLDIAISFLKTTGGNQSENLNTFMVETLQMEHAMTSQKAQQSCEFQHAKSLWLLLSYLKSKFMVDNFHSKQEVFEILLEPYHDELSEELHKSFGVYMKTLSVDKLSSILEILHEFMLLRIARRENTSDEDYIDNIENRLGEELLAFVELMETPCIDTVDLAEFPKEIHFKQSVCSWIMAYQTLRKRMVRKRH